MKNKNLAFIDIETTGFNLERHEIIEIGVIIIKQQDGVPGSIVDEFEIKITPARIQDADPEALAVNGYNQAAWMFAVDLLQAMQLFAEKTRDCVMVAHNVSFDYSFLAKAFATTGVEDQMFYAKLDTISYAVAKLGNKSAVTRFSLGFLCEYYGIQNEHAHTALADARATSELYRKLVDE